MEEALQEEKPELEYKDPNEDQGGIRRRLRDRDLLRKRKAEAEEKETNQEESQRKRRAGDRSGAKKRGRPRKTEPTPDISVVQEEAPAFEEVPAVVVAPQPVEIIPDQTLGSLSLLPAVELQPTSVIAASLPVFGTPLKPLFASGFAPPAPVNPTQSPSLSSVPAPAPTKDKDEDTAPVAVQNLAPAAAAVPSLDADPVPAQALEPNTAAASAEAPATSTDSSGLGPLYIEPKEWENRNLVTIEDLGPDEEEDISLPQDKVENEDLSGTPSNNVPDENKVFSVSTMSSPPPPQERLPGNTF